ncbi:hypothetical protein GGR56DRAFT_677520 [Xylariaceae sp. FL0804]|nr:hypothetical protein GGR56DRAFT_677520 [Xylariaceae sp. FL0804]
MAEPSPSAILLKDVTIITVDQARRVIRRGSILIKGSRIAHVSSRDPPPGDVPEDAEVLSLPGRVVIPGLVNTHAHLAQSLLRGLAEDLPLHSWLCDRIWPLEAAYAGEGDAADGYVAARLTIAEMLLSGTTCFLEAMLTHGSGFDNVARAVSEMGIRACLGKLVKFTETNPALGIADARDRDLAHMSVDALLAAHAAHHGSAGGRIRVWAALGTPRGAPAASFAGVARACAAQPQSQRPEPIGLTMHCAEAPADLPIFRQSYGCSPVEFCRDAGLLSAGDGDGDGDANRDGDGDGDGDGRRTVLAHMVHLDLPTDLPLLRAHPGTSVAHNPASNLKLASGIAPVPALRDAGVNVSLGTDGAPCNNTYDMLRETHLASILHKGATHSASAVGAHAALEMATIQGARALGLAHEIGSLEVGKRADLAVLDLVGGGGGKPWTAPWDPDEVDDGGSTGTETGTGTRIGMGMGIDPVSLLVGSCTGRDVSHVLVDGALLVRDGRLARADGDAIVRAARAAAGGIRARSGVAVGPRAGWTYE